MVSNFLMNTYAPSDLTFEKGEGSWLFTNNGDRYLDFASGIAVNSIGHCHPHLVSEIQKQSARLIHTSNLYNISQQEKLAERLCKHTFADFVNCLFRYRERRNSKFNNILINFGHGMNIG